MSTTMIAGPSRDSHQAAWPHREGEMVARLVRAVAQAGVRIDPAWIVNCYVALKSKPLMVLAGPERSGKALLVKNLTQVLTQDIWRNQMMLGHAWWAERSGDKALFTEAQTRLNSCKIMALVEDASLRENRNRVFVGWLNRISPAELAGLFSELALQLQHKRLMQLPSFHLAEPIACPPNFFLLGTMDTPLMDRSNGDLLSQTTIIPWPAVEVRPQAGGRTLGPLIPDAERVFLHSCIRTEESAYERLQRLQGRGAQLMWPLYVIADLLRRHQVVLPESAMGEAMIYVANAWSAEGEGLFDSAPARNFTIATDLAITQSLLLRAGETIRESAALHAGLAGVLNARLPYSAAFLRNLQSSEEETTRVQHAPAPQKEVSVGLRAPLPVPGSEWSMGDPAFS
jgi:hypothetical protein